VDGLPADRRCADQVEYATTEVVGQWHEFEGSNGGWLMRRWDSVNERQLKVLRRIGAGEDLSGDANIPARTSAGALRNRGLITIHPRAGSWDAEITDAGRCYLTNGYHPEDPRRGTPDEAKGLTAQLIQAHIAAGEFFREQLLSVGAGGLRLTWFSVGWGTCCGRVRRGRLGTRLMAGLAWSIIFAVRDLMIRLC